MNVAMPNIPILIRTLSTARLPAIREPPAGVVTSSYFVWRVGDSRG